MAKFKGRDLLLQVEATPGGGTFNTIGGLRDASISINQEPVDITDKSNAPWRELLEDAGGKTITISGSGQFTDDSNFQIVWSSFNAGTHLNYRIISGAGDRFDGAFMVSSFERSGSYNDAEAFSASFESAGSITYTAAP